MHAHSFSYLSSSFNAPCACPYLNPAKSHYDDTENVPVKKVMLRPFKNVTTDDVTRYSDIDDPAETEPIACVPTLRDVMADVADQTVGIQKRNLTTLSNNTNPTPPS